MCILTSHAILISHNSSIGLTNNLTFSQKQKQEQFPLQARILHTFKQHEKNVQNMPMPNFCWSTLFLLPVGSRLPEPQATP